MKLSKWVDNRAGYILILPAVLLIVIFSVAPILGSLRYAFFDMQLNDRSRNDTYMSSRVNLSLNLETTKYVRYYLSMEEESVKNPETKQLISNINQMAEDLDVWMEEELAGPDLNPIVSVSEEKMEALTAYQSAIINEIDQLYEMDDELTFGEDIKAVVGEFSTSIIEPNFVGALNFTRVLNDRRVRSTLQFTLIFTLISVFFELILGLFLALVMNKAFKGRGLVRTVSLIPWAIPTSVAALMWSYLYNGSSGIVAHLIAAMGFISSPQQMLSSSGSALWAIIIADVWKTTPYMALLLLGGLQTIPDTLYESSALDGARKWDQFLYITLPMLKPSIFVALLFRTLDAFRVFDLIYVLTGGGPGGSTESISVYAYKVMFSQTRFGYGSAMVLIMAIVVGIITFIYIKALNVKLIGEDH